MSKCANTEPPQALNFYILWHSLKKTAAQNEHGQNVSYFPGSTEYKFVIYYGAMLTRVNEDFHIIYYSVNLDVYR